VAARFVGAAAQERHATLAGASPHLGERRLSFRPLESGQVAWHVLQPTDLLVQVGAQQLRHGPELLEPDAHALLAHPARPEAHDEHAVAVVAGRRLVDALGDDVETSRH
jgi:hypothetical protein